VLRGVDSITSSIISRNMNFYRKTLGPLYDRTLCVIGVRERAYFVRDVLGESNFAMTTSAESKRGSEAAPRATIRFSQPFRFCFEGRSPSSRRIHPGDRSSDRPLRISFSRSAVQPFSFHVAGGCERTEADRATARIATSSSATFSRRNTQRVRVEDRCAFVYAR